MVNKIALVAGLAALAEHAMAVGSHRRAHMELERRALAAEARVAELEARAVTITHWTYHTKTIYAGPQHAEPTDVVNVEQPAVVEQDNKPKVQEKQADNAEQPHAAEPQEPAPKEDSQDQAASSDDKSSKSSSGSTSNNSGGSSPLGCKRGFAYDSTRDANAYKASCPTCCWGHDWADNDSIGDANTEATPFPPAKGFEFVPTCWGKPDERERFGPIAQKAIDNGAKALFSFNEPDKAAQANMSPADGARYHQEVFGQFKDAGVPIGSPSVSNSIEPMEGLEWLEQWYAECNGNCHFDFCNLHFYTDAGYGFTLMEHLDAAKNTTVCADKPLWLTEFNLNGNDQTAVNDFVTKYVPLLEEREDVQAYAFFMAKKNYLLDAAGTGASLYGQSYASA